MTSENDATESRSADLDRVMRMIPHRFPFLMIDRVVEILPGKSAIGIKNVTINEPHFQGHFPQEAVMPGVLIIEAMAQTAGVLVVDTLDKADEQLLVYFMTIDNTRFRRKVVPGDTLELHVAITQSRGSVYKFHGEARVDGTKVAEADYSAMIIDPNDERRRG
ncbi:MAG: 3-hydroxyacyl-ACP dehydratase FabZ [Pseudomonadota bacterium]